MTSNISTMTSLTIDARCVNSWYGSVMTNAALYGTVIAM